MVIEAIFAHARQALNRTAIVYDNKKLSYRYFARLIDASRRYLAAQGLGGEGVAVLPIGSLLDAWIVGLALRSLGLTTVVVHSPEEIDQLRLPDIRCIVTTEFEPHTDIAAACTASGRRYVSVPRAAYADAAAGAVPRTPGTPATRGGNILLTSGTTGRYKKLLFDAAYERADLELRKETHEISKRSVVNLSNFGGWTAVGYKIALATWDAGGCVVMDQGPNRHEAFRHRGITHTIMTPQMVAELLAAPAGALRRDDAMRLFVTGGPLPPTLAWKAKAQLTSRIYTCIASTEASTITVTPLEQAEDLRWHRIVASRTVEIVDAEDRLVPAGQVGQVRIRPIGGVNGYLHDEEAARAFSREGYFYPGDLGVIGPDGRLALHGRVTDVINILGQKIAAGPVEEALQDALHVTGACVFSMQDENGEEILHVTIEAPRPLALPAITAALGKLLPGQYRTQIDFADALPRNSMGKIQRDVLKQRRRMPT